MIAPNISCGLKFLVVVEEPSISSRPNFVVVVEPSIPFMSNQVIK